MQNSMPKNTENYNLLKENCQIGRMSGLCFYAFMNVGNQLKYKCKKRLDRCFTVPFTSATLNGTVNGLWYVVQL